MADRAKFTEAQIRAVHRATWMREAIDYRGYDEPRAAAAYENHLRYINKDGALDSYRAERIRDDEWAIAVAEVNLQEAVSLGFVVPVDKIAAIFANGPAVPGQHNGTRGNGHLLMCGCGECAGFSRAAERVRKLLAEARRDG